MKLDFWAAVPLWLACALAWAPRASAEAAPVNADDLPHRKIQLPNGTEVEVVIYQGHDWLVQDVSVLSGDNDQNPDICFEAKFESVVQPDKLKLFGRAVWPSSKEKQWATIILDDRLKQRALRDFKTNDNLWFCGTLRKRPQNQKELELVAADILKQPPDMERFKRDLEKKIKLRDGEALIELGHKIQEHGKTETPTIDTFDSLNKLSTQAFEAGLKIEEEALKPDDVDRKFALAKLWRELVGNNARSRRLVLECLKQNPDHPGAGEVAEKELGMKKYNGWWHTPDEIAEFERVVKEGEKKLADAKKATDEAREKDRKEVERNRTVLLADQAAKLRLADPQAREKALLALGEAVRKCPDPGFGMSAVDILVNLPDAAAVQALCTAAKSDIPEVRGQVCEALAWRGGARQDQPALEGLQKALAVEADTATARAALAAVAALDRKAAAGVLVAGLDNTNSVIQDEIMEKLKTATGQQLGTKQEWQAWWAKNKDSLKPN
ncbi:MAG: HEAT repeat domain-containing protein [Planctomycetota bacterium]